MGELAGGAIDLLGALLQPESGELRRVGAEGVGLQHLGSGPHVELMDLLHQRGLLEGQLVVAHVHEHAPAVKHRAHRTVEHVHAPVAEHVPERLHVRS
jgi:hypothetical protein